MAKAFWKGVVIAEGDDIEIVENNVYFAPSALDERYLRPASHTTVCPWKGTASYFDVVVGDDVNAGAAWTYRTPRQAAAQIKDRVAFWRGVTVER